MNLEWQEELAVFQRQESRLIAIVAYELWNPLSTIQICLETLTSKSSIDLELKQEILDSAIKDVKYLRQLIQEVINLSSVESVENCDPREVGTICGLATRSLRDRGNITKQSLQQTIDRLLQFFQEQNLAYLIDPQEKDLILSASHLEAIDHIRNNFIAIVGHELRTPLCTIQICLESITQEQEISKQYEEYNQRMLEIALNDLERLKKLIRDFFILARLQQGQIYYRQEYTDIQTIIELAITGFKSQKNSQSFPKIDIELPLQLPKIKTDADRLIQAITNLLDNACKFTQPQGTITIAVQLFNENKEQPSSLSLYQDSLFLEVIVSDTGRGISPHNLDAIFSCFYQEENALKRTVNGVGIGLTICDRIIQNLGGKIWANSAGKEQGSSIHFTVPVTI